MMTASTGAVIRLNYESGLKEIIKAQRESDYVRREKTRF